MLGSIRCTMGKRTACAALATLLVLVFAVGQAVAEQKANQPQSDQKLQEAKQKAKNYSEKLRNIQKSVMEKNPELKERREELRQMQKNKMNDLVSENATRKEKVKAVMQLRQDQELMKKRKSLQKDFLKAMKKEDPKTQEYLDKLDEARKTMRRINQNRTGSGQQGQMGQ
ncbi:MAG: hypothetical protein V5B78_11480 [Desulfohalobiaceae bacterium]